ncbi:MAG: hypothetical protein E7596_05290 [Ruminococcaceae bacterium]|nr:hypothetical protein [Oscillospiraceae bacterium]
MKDFFLENNIEFYSMIPLSRCKILKEYLLTKNGFDTSANAITMLFPYRSEKKVTNLSVYASVKDYHTYVEELCARLELYVKKKYPTARFKLFADHSPIDEVHAACISGLGFIGDNGLLINEKYSSFVFLGECIIDLSPEELGMEYARDVGVKECLHCGKCAQACPCGCIKKAGDVADFNPKTLCLSAITQKKGELSEGEKELMLQNNTVWGCDICQNACPYTKNAEFTPIEYFQRDVITTLDLKTLDSLDDEEFKKKPFAWRGRSVIERNVRLYEDSKHN